MNDDFFSHPLVVAVAAPIILGVIGWVVLKLSGLLSIPAKMAALTMSVNTYGQELRDHMKEEEERANDVGMNVARVHERVDDLFEIVAKSGKV